MKTKTVKEFRKQLRSLKLYFEELTIGKHVICKTTTGYGIRFIGDESDPMTDYCAFTFGFKEKMLIDRFLNEGLLKN